MRIIGWGAAAVVALLLIACGSGAGEWPAPTTTLPEQPTAAIQGTLAAGDPGVTVANVVQACREKDAGRLRSFIAGTVADDAIEVLFSRGSDVQLVSQTVPEPEDGHATVTVGLRVRRDGESDLVRRTWDLERGADGVWRLTALPDCY